MKLSKDTWLAVGLFIVLVSVTSAATIQRARQEAAVAYTSASSDPDGVKALAVWLEDTGYQVNQEAGNAFHIPQDANLILMLEPFASITPDEWLLIDSWIEDGGVLVVAGDQIGAALAAAHYNFNRAFLNQEAPPLSSQTPLFKSPPLEEVNSKSRSYFSTQRSDYVTHLAVSEKPVVVSFQQGQGRVILSATAYPFSNAGLKETGNPLFVLNIISHAGQPGTIWFNEWHHGLRTESAQIVGPWDWLRQTATGRSLLYAAGVILFALLLRGQRFGRPVPLPDQITRRGPMEYITAIANLNRRAGNRSAILSQYHSRLKRGLGQRYRLNPTLPDEVYLTQLKQLNPNLDSVALGKLLARLRRKNISENELIQLASEVGGWLKES